MHMLLRPYNDRYRLHQRLQAPLLNPRSAATYRPLQELEAQKTLFSLLREADSSGPRGVDYHHQVERAMASLIYSLEYGFRLQTGHEQPLQDGKKVQAEFARTGEVGAYLVDSMPALNHLPAFLAPWKREGEELYQLERNLHEGNLQTGLDKPGWNFTKAMTGNPEAKGVSRTELAFSLGIVADAGLDTSTVALDWFAVAWLCGDGRWVRKAQALLDEVVGTGRMPTFEDRPKLPYIDAIGMSFHLPHTHTIMLLPPPALNSC